MTGSQDRVDCHLQDARRAEREGDIVGAVNTARLARQLAPDRPDVAAEYERLSRALSAASAPDNEAEALTEERAGRWASASIAWGKVCEGRPNDVRALRHAANALVEAKGDLRRARGYAQRAVEQAPNDVECLVVLVRVYMAAGMKLNAQRELETAAKLSPNDPIVKALIRELKALP